SQSFNWLRHWVNHYLDDRSPLSVVTGRRSGQLVLVWPRLASRAAGLIRHSGGGNEASEKCPGTPSGEHRAGHGAPVQSRDWVVLSGSSMIPKKPAPHLMRGGNRFSERDHASSKELERYDDSRSNHPALVRARKNRVRSRWSIREGACMPQMMLSHSRDNRQFVDKLAIALRKRGLDIWYDCDLRPGDDFRKEIRQQIITSPSVLVVWSKSACHSKWVPAEADLADSHNKLLQVISEPCDLPLPFGNKNYTDLTGWNGDPFADEMNRIVAAAGHLIERASSRSSNQDVAASVADDLAETRAVLADVARLEVSEFIAKGEVS